jgi:hypothetical protein
MYNINKPCIVQASLALHVAKHSEIFLGISQRHSPAVMQIKTKNRFKYKNLKRFICMLRKVRCLFPEIPFNAIKNSQ